MMRTAAAAGTAAALILALAGPVAARPGSPEPTVGAAGLGDPVYPGLGNGGYSVSDYDLDLAYDPLRRMIDARVVIRAEAEQLLSRFNLDAAGLDISAVTVNGSPARHLAVGEELQITPARMLRPGRPFTVTVDYAADPRRIPPPAGGFVATADGFATAPQPAGAHTVFPCNDHPSDKAGFTVRITAPAGTVGVASGSRVATTVNADGTTTSVYRSRDPIATELVQISVGSYSILERGRHHGPHLRDVVPTLRVPASAAALALTPGQIDWAVELLGDFPMEAYGLLLADTDDPDAFDFTGLETQTLTIYKPAFLAQPEEKIAGHMMHEIVHNWFGNSVTPSDWSALWINEGHAELYGLMYRYSRGWPDARGYPSLEERMRYTYSQGDIWRAGSGPVARPNAENLFDNQRYTGATLVLYALAQRVGAEVFTAIEREFVTRYRYGNAGTEDFIAVAAEVSGDPGVEPFLADWLYGTVTPPMPNHPDWVVDALPPAQASVPDGTRSQAEARHLRSDHLGRAHG